MLRVRTIVLTTLVACAQPAATTSSRTPPPPAACVEPTGAAIRWAAAYCEYNNETDDFESDGVTACMHELDARKFASPCEEKRFYKAGICKIAKPSEPGCVDDPAFIPTVVANGVGGD